MKVDSECSICGCETFESLGVLDFVLPTGSSISGHLSVVCCGNCGFVSSRSSSSQEDYYNYYRSLPVGPAALLEDLGGQEREYIEETVGIIKRYSSKVDAVFDIGSGSSPLLKLLADEGYGRLYAVDVSEKCAVQTAALFGIRSAEGSLDSVPFREVEPDFVVLSHVVEHFVDARAQLEKLAAWLKDGQKVFVEVPDSLSLESFSAADDPLSFFYYTHLLHFDKVHFRRLFELFGFNVLEIGSRIRYEKGIKIPSLWAVFEKSVIIDGAVRPDFSLAGKVKKWFQDGGIFTSPDLEYLVETQKSVYVWGMGMHAHMLLGRSRLRDCNVKALVDRNADLIGVKLGDMSIQSSDLLYNAESDECVFITALVNKELMVSYLTETVGFKGQVVALS